MSSQHALSLARVRLVAWPCKEYILDNGQFQTMISAHLGRYSSPWLASPSVPFVQMAMAGGSSRSRRLQSY
jgi:hypothetical protein